MTKRKRAKLENEFNAMRKQGNMKVQHYLDALTTGMEKGITGAEYTSYAGTIFSAFLMDLGFQQITDAVFAKDETASMRVFKKEMQRLLRENGTSEEHYLLQQ